MLNLIVAPTFSILTPREQSIMNGRAQWSFTGVVVAWFVVALAGCGTDDPLNRQPVSGTVSLDGQPLANGTIEFQPLKKGVGSGAVIEKGEFVIPAAKGLPPGEYIVRVSAAADDGEPQEFPGESDNLAVELIPAEFNTESDVRFSVKDEEDNVLELKIPSAAGTALGE